MLPSTRPAPITSATITPVVTYLENRAYDTMAAQHKREQKKTKVHKQARRAQIRQVQALSRKASVAAQEEAQAVALADDVALLARWLHSAVCAVSGSPTATAARSSMSSAPNAKLANRSARIASVPSAPC